jgi:enoyl-CoA hydratase
MSNLLTYELSDGIATLTMDDGKANVMSTAMQQAIHGALDQAEVDGAVVLLAGRPGVFSGGFDLKIVAGGGQAAADMILGGWELATRVLAFPSPVVVACTGHAIAMGAFLLLCGDHNVGADGPFRVAVNEVAIGLTMPYTAVEILRQRLTPAALNRAALLSQVFSPEAAVSAGFLDEVVAPDSVVARARDIASLTTLLDRKAHRHTKLRVRGPALEALAAALAKDRAWFEGMLAPTSSS